MLRPVPLTLPLQPIGVRLHAGAAPRRPDCLSFGGPMPPQRLLSQVHRLTAAWRVLAAALLVAALVQPGGTPALAAAPAQALVAAAPAAACAQRWNAPCRPGRPSPWLRAWRARPLT